MLNSTYDYAVNNTYITHVEKFITKTHPELIQRERIKNHMTHNINYKRCIKINMNLEYEPYLYII